MYETTPEAGAVGPAQQPHSANATAIRNNMTIIATLPDVLQEVQLRVSKAENVGRKLLQEIDEQGMTPERDALVKDYIVKIAALKKELENKRKPATQSFDIIKTMFTSEEAKIDPKGEIISQLQRYRNEFAAAEAARIKREQEEAERKIQKGKEAAAIAGEIILQISNALINFLDERKKSIQGAFNNIILEVFAEKEVALRNMVCEFPEAKMGEIVKINIPPHLTALHTSEERQQILHIEWQKFDFASFKQRYQQEITDIKTRLISELPAKKAELEAQAEAERKRIEAAEAARKAQEEADRKAREAKSEADRKAAEESRKAAEEAEAKRVQAEAEQKRLAEEQRAREEEEARKAAEDLQRQQDEAKAKAAQQQLAMETNTLFSAAAGVSSSSSQSKTTMKAVLTNNSALVDIFTFWYMNEGAKLPMEDACKKSLNQMIAYAEKQYAAGNQLHSTAITWTPETKAINRASKK